MSKLNQFRVRLQSKFFIYYLILFSLFFTLPLTVFSLFLVQNVYYSLIDKEEDELLVKSKAISASLESSIKDRIYPSKNSKEWVSTYRIPNNQKTNLEPILKIVWENENPFFYFQRNVASDIEIWKFRADFLIDKMLDSDLTSPNEIIITLNNIDQKGISSVIEDNFQINQTWRKAIEGNKNLNFLSLFRKSSDSHFVISSRMPTLPFHLIIIKSKDDIVSKVRSGLIRIGISFILILIFVTAVSYFIARYMAELKKEKNKLSSFVNNLPIGAAIVTKDLNIIASNKILNRIFEENVDLQNEINKDSQFRINTSKKDGSMKYVWEIQRKKTWEVTLSPWYGEKDEPEGYSIILRDLTAKKIMFEQEMEMAKAIQEEYLPNDNADFIGLKFKVFYKPYYQVGGDYYDFIQLDQDRYLFVMADVIGHGLQAAMMMTVVKVLFLQITATSNDYLDILKKLAVSVRENLPPGKSIVPLHFIVFNVKEKKIDYANAGHPGLFYQENKYKKDIQLFDKLNPVLGLQLSQDRYTKIITLNYQENSRFFLFTDGLMDVMNNSSEPFGEEKIQEFVTNNGHLSINEFSTKLEAEILSHSEGRRYPDDITWFVIDAE